ncbi:hypothetical protein [Nocardioides sp. IC4_145]|uniref:hypothetical protein n=1 Tax=Nocardioides sp. IC4_145 TaxID=2714037 RepID=UPI001A987B83|nr:hypothetical protein [Nocardioides sp. IC4_145]
MTENATDQLPDDHLEVRDLSYDFTRTRQMYDLFKQSLFDPGFDSPGDAPAPDRLELYMKIRARGAGYVADFVYTSRDLPVRVYGILVNRGRGLEVAELELFKLTWRYEDGGDEDRAATDHDPGTEPGQLVTSDLLRRIPLGKIVARAQATLAQDDWRSEGVTQLGLDGRRDIAVEDLLPEELSALETATSSSAGKRRGRPGLPDTLLEDVARAYLQEAADGPGLTGRLATKFGRPEPTVRDWIGTARRRGFLSPGQPGRRGAGPGPRLVDRQEGGTQVT